MIPVLIPTSGIGSRLGNLTSYTNKSLVPVGERFALSRIIESYDESTDIIITVGYKGDLVRQFCSLAYPTRNISFVDVNMFEGPGSSLIYSILQAKKYLQKPFILHCCDTILTEKIVFSSHSNCLLVHKDEDYLSYASICGENGRVFSIHRKGFEANDFCYTGVAYYKEYETFWKTAEKLYNEDITNQSLSDIHCIEKMIEEGFIFNYITSEVYDTGNLVKYEICQKHFHSKYDILTKPNESLCFFPDKVIKFQADKTINEKRYQRGLSLQPYVPTILDKRDCFLSMQFVNGTLLSEDPHYGNVLQLLEWAQKYLWINPKSSDIFIEECKSFYITKTLERLRGVDLSNETHTVNGIYIGSIKSLLDDINISLLTTDRFTHFHGDFIFDNILKRDDGSFCLLDWRHEFGKQLYHGDLYYDLAKLRHNLIFNHKNIANNLFTIEENHREVNVDLKCNYILMKQLEDFDSFLMKYNYNKKKVEILTAIIWLNMAPLYEGPLQRFLFYFGKLNLYLALSTVLP